MMNKKFSCSFFYYEDFFIDIELNFEDLLAVFVITEMHFAYRNQIIKKLKKANKCHCHFLAINYINVKCLVNVLQIHWLAGCWLVGAGDYCGNPEEICFNFIYVFLYFPD